MIDLNKAQCRAKVEALPPYLRDVLKLMAEGKAVKEIAGELALTESTVYVYRERTYSKLQVNNLALATRVAIHAGLI